MAGEAGTIDSLAIEIGASSSNAEKAIENLAAKLRDLKNAVKGGAPQLEGWATQLEKLGNAAKNMGGSAEALSKVASSAAKLSALKNVSIPKTLPDNIKKIAEASKNIKADSVNNLDMLTRAMQRLANVKAENLRSLSLFRMPFIPETSGEGIESLANASKHITQDVLDKLSQFADVMERLRGVDFSGLAKLQSINVPRPSGGANGSSTLSFWKTFTSTIAREAKKAAQSILSLTKALGQGFLSAVTRAGKAGLSFASSIATAPYRRFADTISDLKKRMDNLASSFARIMLYRGIRTIIKELSEAMKYGEENAYWFSKKFGEATQYISEAYDAYASATEMMKNQVGAAWATLFANIQPIIEAITDMVAKAAQVVTQFFAALGGKTTYLKATKYAKDWKEETEDATKAAKEWKNQIMGFDEINRLEEQSDGSSSKIKNNTPDYGKMFKEVAVDSEISDLANKMKDLWNKEDWKGLGELIAQTLNDLFPSEETWKEWGKRIGNGIDGAVQTAYYALKNIEFYEWGRRIASGVNAALEEIEFEYWGRLLIRKTTAALDMAIGFIKGLDFREVGKSIGDFFRGAFDEASEWLSQYNWSEMSGKLWEKIKDLVKGFEVPTFASSLGNFIVTAANSAADFLNGIDFTDVVTTIETTLKNFIDNVKLDEVKSALGNLWEAVKKAFTDTMTTFGEWLHGKNEEGAFSELGSQFNEGLLGFIADVKELASAVPFDEIGTAIGDFIKEIHWREIFDGVWQAVKPHFEAAASWFFGEESGYLGEKIIGLKLAFDMAGPVLGNLASALALKMLNPIAGVVPKLTALAPQIGSALSSIGGFFTSAGGLITAGIAVAVAAFATYYASSEEFRNKVSAIWNGIKNAFFTPFNAIKDLLSGDIGLVEFSGRILGGLVSFQANVNKALLAIVDGVIGGIGTWILDIGEALENAWNSFTSYFKDKFLEDGKLTIHSFLDGILSVFSDIKGWILEHIVNPFTKGFREAFDTGGVKEESHQSGKFVVDSMKAGIDENLPEISNSIETELPKSFTSFREAFSDLQSESSQKWGDIKNTVTTATGEINSQSVSDTQTLYNDVTGIYGDIDKEAVRTFTDISKSVPQIMNYVSGEFKKSVEEMSSSIQQMYNDVSNTFADIEQTISESIDRIRSLMDFEWSIPRPKIPRITWYYDTVHSGDGSSYQIPQFDVQWFAKGGVLDRPTLFGMGDAGAEALVPLEKNTEWIGKVAQEMNRQSEQDGYGNDDMTVTIYTAAAQIVQAIQEGNGRRNNVSINVNGREFFRATYEDQQAVAREKGTSLIIA